MKAKPMGVLLVILAGWMNRHQQDGIVYVKVKTNIWEVLMKNLTLLMLGAILALGAMAHAAEEKVISLYDGLAPGSEDWKHTERQVKTESGRPRMIFNVAKPTLTVFQPQAGIANGTGVVICPGGGFFMLAIDHEGYDVARYLTAKGVTCFVLKYRLLPCETENPMREASSGGNYLEKVAPIIKLALADGLAAMAHVRIPRRRCLAFVWH